MSAVQKPLMDHFQSAAEFHSSMVTWLQGEVERLESRELLATVIMRAAVRRLRNSVFSPTVTRQSIHEAMLAYLDGAKAEPVNPAKYDAATDTLTIFNVKYAAGLFHHLGVGLPGEAFRIVSRELDCLTLERVIL